jgi:hypothetical protein
VGKSNLCLLSCNVLKGEIQRLVEEGSLNVEPYYLDMSLHMDHGLLEKNLKQAVEKTLRNSRQIVAVYGDLCLPGNEMRELMHKYGVIKIDALNCIDCLLGGKGKFLEIDPNQECLFLSPGWIRYFDRLKKLAYQEEYREAFLNMFSGLKGIILLDSLGDLDTYEKQIEEFRTLICLPILERKEIGLESLRQTITEAVLRHEDKTRSAEKEGSYKFLPEAL